VAGSIELEIDKRVNEGAKFVHVEGQGSLTHQGYSSVTLGLLHGVMPDAMVMVHHPARHVDDYNFSVDNVRQLIEIHEMILAPFRISKVVAIALNTVNMTSQQVESAKRELEQQTGLPVGNVLTDDVKRIAGALIEFFDSQKKGIH